MSKLPAPNTIAQVLELAYVEPVQVWAAISLKTITLLYGSTGVGKSLFTLGLGIAVASKEKFCGIETKHSSRILFLDGEMDKNTWAKRIRMLRSEEELHVQCDSISFLTREDFGTGLVPNISDSAHQEMYSAIFAPYELIIIDNLNTCSYPTSDWDGEIQQFLRVLPWLLKLRDSGKAVILVHHTNKEGKQMGSILKEQVSDNVIQLMKLDSPNQNLKFRIQYEKHRHLSRRDAKNVDIEMIQNADGVTWLTEDPAMAVEQQIREYRKKGRSAFDALQTGAPSDLVMRIYEDRNNDDF